ncbi:MAG: hypothetical protein IH628_00800, partial [Proteobacteria bacterium]|nr:hypothetical protein [Pseudomonadota bacterium]
MKALALGLALMASGPAYTLAQDKEPNTPSTQSSPFSQAKFVPDISLILDCSYDARNTSDEEFEALAMPGLSDAHQDMHAQNGFNLNYAEITFYSVVDPYFEVFAVCHLAEEHFHLEEAYSLTRRFPAGFQLKIGKFFSSFGRINEQHAHYWDFADAPLISRVMFGGEGLNEVGARVTWVSPLDIYLMVGGEVLQGKNEASFGTGGFEDPLGSVTISSAAMPALFVGYLRSSVDIDDASVLFGVSAGHGRRQVDEGLSIGDPGGRAFAGTTTVLACDLTIKYLLDAIRYVSFQSEYIWRSSSGTLYAQSPGLPLSEQGATTRRSGAYAQSTAKLDLRWRAGIRCD